MAISQEMIMNVVAYLHQSSSTKKIQKLQDEHHQRQMETHQQLIDEFRAFRTATGATAPTPMQGMTVMTPQGMHTLQPMMALTPVSAATPAIVTDAPAPTPTEDAQKPYSNYAPDMDVSIGCVPCTRSHLITISEALQDGDSGAAREEMAALLEYDLTPEKLERTPERDREVLNQYADEINGLKQQLDGPYPKLTVAAASLSESLRFAREDGLDHPEVEERFVKTEGIINNLERVTFSPQNLQQMSPEQAARVRATLPQLRKLRQDLVNQTVSVEDLEKVSARLSEIDRQLNPPLTGQQLQAVQSQATDLNQRFRKDVVAAHKAQPASVVQPATPAQVPVLTTSVEGGEAPVNKRQKKKQAKKDAPAEMRNGESVIKIYEKTCKVDGIRPCEIKQGIGFAMDISEDEKVPLTPKLQHILDTGETTESDTRAALEEWRYTVPSSRRDEADDLIAIVFPD